MSAKRIYLDVCILSRPFDDQKQARIHLETGAAEYAQADFVTVDDRLRKQCHRLAGKIWSGSPLAYCDKENLQ